MEHPPRDNLLATRTTTRLLDALKERANEPAWEQLDARYRPVIVGLARRLGADRAAAEEAAQQTMAEFVQAYRLGKYDRGKGRLSSWILGIARYTTLSILRRSSRGGRGVGGSTDAFERLAEDEPALRQAWIDERDSVILRRALSVLRDETSIDDRTLTAFELIALRGVPAAEVAAQCGMNTDQVYVAKSRVAKSLRTLVHEMTEAFEEDT